ncbi:Ulp1 family isopeptidase [Bradyrhizobium sp. BR 1432]|uniref:Ulp1 family isopeptidase n=1 Tax=Bradyrhizobium sp. BR 1432 TaxID=3447966 RepID=UPI003EE48B5B
MVGDLHHLSRWLREENRSPISGRFNPDSPGHGSFVADVQDYLRDGGRPAVVGQLNKVAPGSLPSLEQMTEDLPAEDADLLAKFRVKAEEREVTSGAISNSLSGFRNFARWLQANNKGTLASRLRGGPLDDEISVYRRLGRDPQKRLKSALNDLRAVLPGCEEAEGLERRGIGRPRYLAPHPEDAALIDGALGQALKDLKTPTAELRQAAQKRAGRLRALSAWLKEGGKQSIAGRLNSSSKEQLTLHNDVEAFQLAGRRLHSPDLSHLRSYLKLVEANQAVGLQAREQSALPAGLCAVRPSPPQSLPATRTTASQGAWALLRLEMRERASPSAARAASDIYGDLAPFVDLNAPTLSELRDDAHFAPAPCARARSDTYGGLASFVDLNAPTPSELRDDAHFAPAPSASAHSDAYGGLASLVDLNAPTPSELRDDAHFAPAPSASARSDTYGGLASLVDLNAPTPSELRDDAHFAPAPPARSRSDTYGGLASFVDLNAPTPSELRDDAHFAPAPCARARSDTYGGLASFVDLNAPTPSELRDDAHFAPAPSASAHSDAYGGLASLVDLNAPTPSELRDDAHFAPAPSASARSDTYGGLASFVDLNPPTPSELRDDAHFGPAPSARSRSDTYGGLASFVDLNAPTPSELRDDAHFAPALSGRTPTGIYRGLSLVDLTTPTPSGISDEVNSVRPFPTISSDAQSAALDPTALSRDRGLVLEDTQWLGDEHIHRDYELLEQWLQSNHPGLAARTQLVDPMVAHYQLRLAATDSDARRTLQLLIDRNGNDTADFLFLPMNDADRLNQRGNHWSLLFVDRRDRQRPVAYHYDSVRGSTTSAQQSSENGLASA